jgi:hypothetical protein
VDFSNYWRQGQNWDTGLPFLNGQKKPVLIATDQKERHRKDGQHKNAAPERAFPRVLQSAGVRGRNANGGSLTSCCGGSSGGGGGSVVTGAQAGTCTITVSASATTGSTMLTHTTKLTLIVQ